MKSSIANSIWLVFLLVAFAYAEEKKLTDAQKAVVKKFTDECLSAGHATPDLLQHLHEGKITNPDEKTKCFVKCFYEKVGFIVDGKYSKDVIMQKLGPMVGDDHLKETMEKCKDVTGDNDCDKAYKINVCFAGDHKFIF